MWNKPRVETYFFKLIKQRNAEHSCEYAATLQHKLLLNPAEDSAFWVSSEKAAEERRQVHV